MKSISSFRCARPVRRRPEDELIAWARGVAARPDPLVTDHERGLIASLVLQTEAMR